MRILKRKWDQYNLSNHQHPTKRECFRTAETFVDGWVHTGDEVIIKNLEVFIVDRLKVSESTFKHDLVYLQLDDNI